ncbi:MAG TPA: GMC family oxidoreductase, partial [Candidatus Binatia bacterium]|nr:GMC family oxidoreductase [Candidatus Binatia bacterium]
VPQTIADVCIVGVGGLGGIMAKELASAGLKVVGLERGPAPKREDYAPRDSIRFLIRPQTLEWVRHEPTTTRRKTGEKSRVQYRTSPLNVLGGALLHWTGQSSRYMPGDFKLFTNEIASGNADRARADLTGYDIIDWPLSYDDLEPHYEKFEWEFGISGEAGANPFAGPRKRGFPLPPLRHSARMRLFAEACRKLGYHPYDTPAGITSAPYKPAAPFDTRIAERPACVYCGHCNFYGCHVHAKAASLYITIPVALETGNFDLKTNCKVFRIDSDHNGNATAVRYFDAVGCEQRQRARVVILSAFVFEHARLLLLSRTDSKRFSRGLANSSGYVGRNILAHGDVRAMGAFDDFIINGFIGPGSAAMRIDDFNGNNFDHTGLGFIRGGTIGTSGDGTPVTRVDVLPPGVPAWGKAFKEYYTRYYTRTMDLNMQPETLPHKANRVDLDPRARDRWGLPLPRVTFDFHTNELRLQKFMAGVGEKIMRATGANRVWTEEKGRPNRWAGGTRMGAHPRNSVVNEFCQTHDIPNLFIVGSSVFPTMSGYPPTATVAALSYRTADYIVRQKDWFK